MTGPVFGDYALWAATSAAFRGPPLTLLGN